MPRSPTRFVRSLLLAVVGCAALWGCSPSAGASPTAPPATPSPDPSFANVDGGTITLTDEGCTWDGNPASVSGAQASVEIRNETGNYGAFFVHRLKPEFTWDDGVAAIAAIAAAVEAGEDWPNWAMNVSIVMSQPVAEAGATVAAFIGPTGGTFGVVCSANTSARGDVLSVFLVGPLDVGP